MSEWRKIVIWFEMLKQASDVEITDRFVVKNRSIQVEGEELSRFLADFWEQEGEFLHEFSIADMDKRMRLKAQLMTFIQSFDDEP